MINRFPPEGQDYSYLQTNRSDDLGSLWSTMGLDFQSNLGEMRLAPRLKLNTSSASDADLGCPVAFSYFDRRFWAICGSRVFKNTGDPQTAFVEDNSTSAQTDYSADISDMLTFSAPTSSDTFLYTTTTDALYRKTANGSGTGTWTSINALASGNRHLLTNFKKFNRIYVTSNFSVDSYDGTTFSTSGDYTLQLEEINQITAIRSGLNSVWIGISSISTAGDKTMRGKIYQWDGISAQITNEYLIDASGVMSIVIDEDIPYIMDSNGVLLKYTGSSFEEIGRLPVQNKYLINAASEANDRFIHPNGLIATKNKTFLALIDNLNGNNAGTINENLPSGVWEFSSQIGFTHKYAFTYNPVASGTITDYGQNRVSRVGALANADIYSTDSSRNGTIMAGCTYYTNASDTLNGIFIDDSNNTIQKKGYFVTTWFKSREVQDQWQRVWAIYRKLLDSADSIVFKYRIYEEDPIEATITWVDTTHFTTTTDISVYGPSATGFDGTTGGEVEVTQGTGGASCVHITALSEAGGTYTATVDSAVTGVTTGTAKARFQKWIKMFPEITGQINSYTDVSITGTNNQNPRVQIKCCMTFTGDDEFHKFALVSNEDIKIK